MNEQNFSNPDVYIRFGKVPENIEDPLNKGVIYESANNEFIFNIQGTCKYFVHNGNEIIIDKDKNATDKDIYTFMAGSAFGALLQQRGQIALHACTVQKGKNSVMIMGKTGVGKSTAGIYFHKNNYNIISDDISVISNNNREVELGPSYIKVWHDVLKQFGLYDTSLQKLRDGIEKYIYPISQEKNPASIKAIFILRNVNTRNFKAFELKGNEKFEVILKNLYKPQFARKTLFEQKSFMALTQLVNNLPVHVIERGRDRFYQDLIENEIIPYLV